jgi:hypothetical protein
MSIKKILSTGLVALTMGLFTTSILAAAGPDKPASCCTTCKDDCHMKPFSSGDTQVKTPDPRPVRSR